MLYVKFIFKAMVGIGTSGGVRPLYRNTPMVIEQSDPNNAMALMTTLSNNDKVYDATVTVIKPSKDDKETIVIGMDGCTKQNDHLVSNNEVQSFVWALKAGMQMQRGRGLLCGHVNQNK